MIGRYRSIAVKVALFFGKLGSFCSTKGYQFVTFLIKVLKMKTTILSLLTHWTLTVSGLGGIASWDGPLDTRVLVSAWERESVGTLCARVLINKPASEKVNWSIEWGTQAHSKRENGPNSPSDTRCIVRSTTKGSTNLIEDGSNKTIGTTIKNLKVTLEAVSPKALGPGWILEGSTNLVSFEIREAQIQLLP